MFRLRKRAVSWSYQCLYPKSKERTLLGRVQILSWERFKQSPVAGRLPPVTKTSPGDIKELRAYSWKSDIPVNNLMGLQWLWPKFERDEGHWSRNKKGIHLLSSKCHWRNGILIFRWDILQANVYPKQQRRSLHISKGNNTRVKKELTVVNMDAANVSTFNFLK